MAAADDSFVAVVPLAQAADMLELAEEVEAKEALIFAAPLVTAWLHGRSLDQYKAMFHAPASSASSGGRARWSRRFRSVIGGRRCCGAPPGLMPSHPVPTPAEFRENVAAYMRFWSGLMVGMGQHVDG